MDTESKKYKVEVLIMNRTEIAEQRNRTAIWAEHVDNIDGIKWPESFKTNKDISKPYNRLTEFTKQWVHGILSNDPKKSDVISKSELLDPDRFFHKSLPSDWWNRAIKLGNGGRVDGLTSAAFLKDREKAHQSFMPAYRAIKESFDSRPFWHWFTHHAEYTAERDTMKALRGIMMSLTGRRKVDSFEADYDQYCEEVPLENEEVKVAPTEVKNVEKVSVSQEVAKDLTVENTQKKEPAVAIEAKNKVNEFSK